MVDINNYNYATIPLPGAALAAILSFLPFPQLQDKAASNNHLSMAVICRAKSIIKQARAGKNYLHFVAWRTNTAITLHELRQDAALARQLVHRNRFRLIKQEEDELAAQYIAAQNPVPVM